MPDEMFEVPGHRLRELRDRAAEMERRYDQLTVQLGGENDRLRREVADLKAENAGLRLELDDAGRKTVLLCPASAMLDAMEASTDAEPGTIMRATDQTGLEFELTGDGQWRRR